MIWLHAPEGYVGPSAALELGVAHAVGIPVFAREAPADVTLRHFAQRVSTIDEAVRGSALRGRVTPARPLSVLQDYYRRIASERGYSTETPQDAMLLLTEEVGELARAIRKTVGLGRAAGFQDEDAAAELADVQLYILHLANILGVSLDEAVAGKERLNAAKSIRPAIAA
jgi:NTP pyrophosphatase (non-canonical NTP hydrolase)